MITVDIEFNSWSLFLSSKMQFMQSKTLDLSQKAGKIVSKRQLLLHQEIYLQSFCYALSKEVEKSLLNSISYERLLFAFQETEGLI